MFTIVNSNMVNGIRRVSVERGYDPRDFVLVGAGGATAAHITSLAGEMGDRYRHSAETRIRALRLRPNHLGRQIQLHGHQPGPARQAEAYRRDQPLFEQIEAQGREASDRRRIRQDRRSGIKRSLDMRYVGQVHECTVDIGNFAIDAKALEQG